MLVSRKEYLEEVFESINSLICDISHTSLLCIVNGEANIYVMARNLCEESKFEQRLCIQEKPKKKIRQYDIGGRRRRISALHNLAKTHINTEYVFGIEDDTIVPPNSLQKLGEQFVDGIGMVEGVEMGRWGVPYIGAWRADDVHNPTEITSLEMQDGTVEIDAGGFYCFLTKAAYYKDCDFKPFDNNGLGPDVDFSLGLRRKGYKNLADFSIQCEHKSADRDVVFGVTKPRQIMMFKKGNQWRQQIL